MSIDLVEWWTDGTGRLKRTLFCYPESSKSKLIEVVFAYIKIMDCWKDRTLVGPKKIIKRNLLEIVIRYPSVSTPKEIRPEPMTTHQESTGQ